MKYREMDSPIGVLRLAADERGLCEIRLVQAGCEVYSGEDPVLNEAVRQIRQFFSGERSLFDLPLSIYGSAFEVAVWQKLREIPYGEIRSYGQIPSQIGKLSAARAVGGACSRNPLLIVVPCHRVVAGSGKLTGFAAGMRAKRLLLEHEGLSIRADKSEFR